MDNFKIFVLFSLIFCIHVTQISGRILESCTCKPTKSCRDANEEYAVDPKRPQNTCEYYGCYNQFQCPGSSETGDCYCKEGYARLFLNGPCISITHPFCARLLKPTPEDCKRRNEVYNEYLGYRACANTCENVGYDCGTINTLIATWSPWCDCLEGYARLPNGKCVPVNSPQCKALHYVSVAGCARRGEVYRVGQICESIPNCAQPNGQEYICMAIGEKERCYCKEGQLRNNLGKCVPKEQCYLYE